MEGRHSLTLAQLSWPLACITCWSKTQLCKVLAYVAALAETNWGGLMEAAEQDKRQGALARAPSLSLVFTVQNLFYSWTSLICSWGKLPIPGMDLSPSCCPDLPRLKQVTLGKQLWKCFWSVLLVTKASLFSFARPMAPTRVFFFFLSPPYFFLWGFKLSGLFCVYEKTSFKTSVKLLSKGSTSHRVHRAQDWILQFKGAAGSFTHLNGWCLVLKKPSEVHGVHLNW